MASVAPIPGVQLRSIWVPPFGTDVRLVGGSGLVTKVMSVPVAKPAAF